MGNYEYNQVSREEYIKYCDEAQQLLHDVSLFANEPVSKINYLDIINYFQKSFNLHFSFFETDPSKGCKTILPSRSRIRYKNIIEDADLCFLDKEVVERISGVTIPQGNRTLIFINQNCIQPRLIFTILHELCHFYFHIRNEKHKEYFVSLSNDKFTGTYSDDLIPFENEANIVSSILFCPKDTLEQMILSDYSFKKMCRTVGMSEAAMHNRLLNYFEHIIEMPYYIALKHVWEIRNGVLRGKNSIRYRIKMMHRNLEDSAFFSKYQNEGDFF
ncbi:TPA: ImmA/IrrE family metallo-endopeptidase [Enterococcus faecium]